MKTAVRRVLFLSALMSPAALYALGLGEIKLNSALNQPFDAEIELVSATDDELGALRASLAPSDAFARYGLDRPGYLSEFSFRVAKGAGGKDVLKVTSPRPVTEPFVTLLVEASWSRGRLLREYTVLLDPAVFAPGQSTAAPGVAAPRVSSGGATTVRTEPPPVAAPSPPVAAPSPPVDQPARAVAPAPAPVAAAPAPSARGDIAPGSTYRVRPNDTLYEIASEANPGTRSDINRAMVAIYQDNPEAFDRNINVLRSGSTLRIPERGRIEAVSAAAASAEVSRQYEEWRSGTTAAAAAPSEGGQLRLVTPEQGTTAPSTATAPTPTAGKAPAAAPGAQSSAELAARVQQLEKELADARRELEVKNAELITLQGSPPVPAEQAPVPGAEAPAVEPAPTAEVPADAPVAQPEQAAPAEKKAEPKKAPPATAEPAGPTLIERLSQYWWALAALLIAGLAAVLVKRMRRERGAAEENLQEAMAGRDMRAPRPTFTPREPQILVEEKRPVEPRPDATTTLPASIAAAAAATATTTALRTPEPVRKPASLEDTMSGEGPTNVESGDPMAEADFHMAYGLYDQAADLVQLAIKREPKRRELKLKLLEIFFVWGNRDRFLELARELDQSRGGAPAGEWDKVLIMGKQMAPEDPLFTGSPRATADSLDMELHSSSGPVDLDVAGDTQAPRMDFDPTGTDVLGTSGIDWVIDEPIRGADESTSGPTVETPRVKRDVEPTAEIEVDDLGLDTGGLQGLDDVEGGEDLLASTRDRVKVEDTVETPAASARGSDLSEDTDMLSSTSLLKLGEETKTLLESTHEDTHMIDLSESTGELTPLDVSVSGTVKALGPTPDYDLSGEPATMSEVGTKLDLARAYMDMGDPEGARSILDEVLQEGSQVQRQEAERLIANLP